MSYKMYFVYYIMSAGFIVYRTSEETDGTPKGNSIIIFSLLYSVLKIQYR